MRENKKDKKRLNKFVEVSDHDSEHDFTDNGSVFTASQMDGKSSNIVSAFQGGRSTPKLGGKEA